MKKELPVWQIIAAIGAAVVLVGLVLWKGGAGDASREEITRIRRNQASFGQANAQTSAQSNPGAGSITPPGDTHNSGLRGGGMDYSRGAPPGGFNGPPN